jgi:hypothetical protein
MVGAGGLLGGEGALKESDEFVFDGGDLVLWAGELDEDVGVVAGDDGAEEGVVGSGSFGAEHGADLVGALGVEEGDFLSPAAISSVLFSGSPSNWPSQRWRLASTEPPWPAPK